MIKDDKFVKNICENAGKPKKLSVIFAEERNTISYKPTFVGITGSVLSAILLNQIMYWANKSGNQFYKFKLPCDHNLYKKGDSWCEELGFTQYEFDGALKQISCRIMKNKDTNQECFVWYYIDSNRLTWYFVNWKHLNKKIFEHYQIDEDLRDMESESTSYELNGKNRFSYLEKTDLAKSGKSTWLNGKNQDRLYIDTETTNKDYYHRRQEPVAQENIEQKKKLIDDDDFENYPQAENPLVEEKQINDNKTDETFRLLKKYGLTVRQCSKIISKTSADEIMNHCDQINKHIETGKVKNIPAYVISCFENSDITIVNEISEKIEAKKRETARNKAETMKVESEAEEKAKMDAEAEERRINGLISQATTEQIENFEKSIANNGILLAKYKETKFESIFIRSAFAEFMEVNNV